MSDWEYSDAFKAMRETGQVRRASNLVSSIALLEERGHELQRLSPTHFRLGKFDFWPSTGKFLNRETKRYGRGVFNLLSALERGGG